MKNLLRTSLVLCLLCWPALLDSAPAQSEAVDAVSGATPPAGSSLQPVAVMTPQELFNAFETDKISARQNYQNKPVGLVGKIDQITTEAGGLKQITFVIAEDKIVQCLFTQEQSAWLADAGPGREIELIGIVEPMMAGRLLPLSGCQKVYKP